MKNLLLISNSTLHGSGYLDHCADEIQLFLTKNIKKVLFVPYARPGGISHDEYTQKAAERFKEMEYIIEGIHTFDNPVAAVEQAESIFIGGGNSFVLLGNLFENGIVESIRKKCAEGMPYIGTSAGSNVACASIMTTNDMPIKELNSFQALALVPFQINPHYLDPDPNSTHKGETRETRINEYFHYNDRAVVGLREGCMLHIEDKKCTLKGTTGARLFTKGNEPKEYIPISDMNFLLDE